MIPATRTTAALTQATTLGWSWSVCISPNSDPTIRAARAMAAAMLPITQLCQRLWLMELIGGRAGTTPPPGYRAGDFSGYFPLSLTFNS